MEIGYFPSECVIYRTNINVGLGNTFGILGRHVEAEQACKLAIKVKPEFGEAYCNLGAAYISRSRWAEAIEALEQALRINQDYAQVHFNLGLACLRAGNKRAALKE